MDAFKHAEIQRMELGGNEPWKSFYDAHATTVSEGRTFEDSTIKERYEGDAGEEWKERLACKVEGREYVPGQEKKNNVPVSRSETPKSMRGVQTASPAASSIRSQDSQRGSGAPTKKEQNEAYFAKLGGENATRSDALPPSQGGKFTGFGGGLPPAAAERRSSPFGGFGGWGGGGGGGGAPALDDLQKDPLGTLTKGLGWFASTVGKSAKQVNDSFLQPTAKQVRNTTPPSLDNLSRSFDCPSLRHVEKKKDSFADRAISSWPNPTLRRRPVFRPRIGVRISKQACAAPQINSTASSKDPATIAPVLPARALNLNVETFGMNFRPLAHRIGVQSPLTSAAARVPTISALLR